MRNHEPLGHYFDVITHGWGAMFGYAERVSVEDRWNIVAYIRVLQMSQNADEKTVAAARSLATEKEQAEAKPENANNGGGQ